MTKHILSPADFTACERGALWHFDGPPSVRRLVALAREVANPLNSGLDFLVVDIRGGSQLDGELVQRLAELRGPSLQWIAACTIRAPARCSPVVLLCRDAAQVQQLVNWATEAMDCPSFWFAAGFELLMVGENGHPSQSRRRILEAAENAARRLDVHPVVTGGKRVRQLFETVKVDRLSLGQPSFDRPTRRREDDRAEFTVFVPGSFQGESGVSHPLPDSITIPVLEHIVFQLTQEEGRLSNLTGYTLIPATGRWFSPNAMQFVSESIKVAVVHAKLDKEVASSIVRYLRFAWLQDEVFATLNGVTVSAEKHMHSIRANVSVWRV